MEKQKYIPELRFPDYRGNWESKTLQDISENGFNNGVFNDPKKVGSGYRIINVKDMYVDGTIDTATLTKVNIDEKEFLNNKVIYGDIFFTRSSLVKEGIAYSNVNLNADDDLTFDGHLIRMRPDKMSFSPIFLYYNFGTLGTRRQFIIRGKTTTMTTIGQEDIASVLIRVPSLSEQQKIASFFTAIDLRISQLKQKKTLLEQYKKGVMQKIFSQEIRFRDDNGQEFPKWEKKRLGEISDRNQKKNKKNTETSVLTNSAVNGIVLQSDYFDKDIANQNNLLNYYIVEVDDFVYNPRISVHAPVGPIKRNHIGVGVMSPLYSVFRFTEGILEFFEYYLSTTYWHEYMKSIANYGARSDRMNITTKDLYSMPIPYPLIEEQTKIAKFLASIDNKISHTQSQIEKAELWKKGLLQKMFV